MTDELQQAVSALAGEAPIGRALLLPLSGLERAAAARLPGLLAVLSIDRQRQIVEAWWARPNGFELDFAWPIGRCSTMAMRTSDGVHRGLWGRSPRSDRPLVRLLEADPDHAGEAAAARPYRAVCMREVDELPATRAVLVGRPSAAALGGGHAAGCGPQSARIAGLYQ